MEGTDKQMHGLLAAMVAPCMGKPSEMVVECALALIVGACRSAVMQRSHGVFFVDIVALRLRTTADMVQALDGGQEGAA